MINVPFLSVILPTYNRRHCIFRMIDSVLMQDFKDFELIVVDDGSFDGTKEMLEERYSDERIRLVYQENKGVSSARNLGISLAKGKYLTFVDSDDYLLDGFFEDIYQILRDGRCEILIYGGYILKHHCQIEVPLFWFDNEYGKDSMTVNHSEDFIKDFCLLGGNSWACAKVFKSSLIQEKRILFDPQITYGEDLLFNIQAYFVSSTILTNSEKFYICDNKTESLSRGILTSKEKCKNLLLVYEVLEKHKDYRGYFALNVLRHMKKWLWSISFFLDKQTREKIRMMASLASPYGSGGFEKFEFRIMQKSLAIASLISCLYFVVYTLYSKMNFLHPLTTPIIKRIKKSRYRGRGSKV